LKIARKGNETKLKTIDFLNHMLEIAGLQLSIMHNHLNRNLIKFALLYLRNKVLEDRRRLSLTLLTEQLKTKERRN